MFTMANAFSRVWDQRSSASDSLLSDKLYKLNQWSRRRDVYVGLKKIVEFINDCMQQRISNNSNSFEDLRDHHLSVELPAHFANSFRAIIGDRGFNYYGSGTEYMAVLHAALALNPQDFTEFMPKIQEEIESLQKPKLAEILSVVLNKHSASIVSFFCESLPEELLIFKRKAYEAFLDEQIQRYRETRARSPTFFTYLRLRNLLLCDDAVQLHQEIHEEFIALNLRGVAHRVHRLSRNARLQRRFLFSSPF